MFAFDTVEELDQGEMMLNLAFAKLMSSTVLVPLVDCSAMNCSHELGFKHPTQRNVRVHGGISDIKEESTQTDSAIWFLDLNLAGELQQRSDRGTISSAAASVGRSWRRSTLQT